MLLKLLQFTKYKLMLLVFLFINQSILSEGFIAQTLVRTQDGYKQIAELKENNFVTSYSFKDRNLVEGKINKIKKVHYKTCFKLTVNGKEIITAPNHKFYCPLSESSRWIKAKDLKVLDFISSNLTECVRIDNIEELNQEADFYCLSIEKYQNYFVSNKNVLVHNFVWWIPLFEIAIGGGIKSLLSISAISSAVAGLAIVHIAKENGAEMSGLDNINVTVNNNKLSFFENLDPNKKQHIFLGLKGKQHGFIGGPNDQDPDKWWKRVIARVKEAYTQGEIGREGEWKVRESQNINPNFGDLIIKGVINSGVIKIGTAFLERK